jgi:hypothetical protein
MVTFHTAESLQPAASSSSTDSASTRADVQLARSMTAVINLLHQLAQRSHFFAPNDALTRHLAADELAAITALDAESQCALSLSSSCEAAAERWQQRRQQRQQQQQQQCMSCDASAITLAVIDTAAAEFSADFEQMQHDSGYTAVQ